ncbi:MAG: NAD(P)-binding domain-containing protein [Eubacterium sp.]|nr:NAD(P)-binding domain-containing protein [Eubacterium sp.]
MKTFSLPYDNDERMIYAKNYLLSHGFEITDDNDKADFILLPVPAKKYMFDSLSGKTVFYGAGDYNGIDYNKREEFLIYNAYLTAEGGIALLKENSKKSILFSNILITGYGRIAKALSRYLISMGANVCVCARSESARLQAAASGASTITFEELKKPHGYDFIFNTVPHTIFTKTELDALESDTVIIDLASFPGGVDTLCAKSRGIKLVDGRALPSRYSPESAGILIAKTVIKIIEEEFN